MVFDLFGLGGEEVLGDVADGDLDPEELEPEEPEGEDGDDSVHAGDGLGGE